MISDPNTDGLGTAASSLGRPLAVQRLGPLRVYVFGYDGVPRFG